MKYYDSLLFNSTLQPQFWNHNIFRKLEQKFSGFLSYNLADFLSNIFILMFWIFYRYYLLLCGSKTQEKTLNNNTIYRRKMQDDSRCCVKWRNKKIESVNDYVASAYLPTVICVIHSSHVKNTHHSSNPYFLLNI